MRESLKKTRTQILLGAVIFSIVGLIAGFVFHNYTAGLPCLVAGIVSFLALFIV